MPTWPEILAAVHDRHGEIRARGSTPYYRGQSDAAWPLLSSAHRFVNRIESELKVQFPSTEKIDLLHREEKSAFQQFKAVATSLLDPLQQQDWALVFAMQHYGLPTRLLDWTTSFACALFFARVRGDNSRPVAVFIVDPQEINVISLKVDGEIALDADLRQSTIATERWHPAIQKQSRTTPTIAVQPVYSNQRMVVQQARFLACGDAFLPIEEQFPCVLKIEIEQGLLGEVDEFLDLVGFNWSSYMPDLEGLARQFADRERYLMEKIREVRTRHDKA